MFPIYCYPQLGVKGGAPPLQVEGSALVAVGETSARKRAVTPHEVRLLCALARS